jgi:hypothetical protein
VTGAKVGHALHASSSSADQGFDAGVFHPHLIDPAKRFAGFVVNSFAYKVRQTQHDMSY